jgi:hypothetical protein
MKHYLTLPFLGILYERLEETRCCLAINISPLSNIFDFTISKNLLLKAQSF